MQENSDIFDMPLDDSKDIVRSPRTQSVKINGRRERIASGTLGIGNYMDTESPIDWIVY